MNEDRLPRHRLPSKALSSLSKEETIERTFDSANLAVDDSQRGLNSAVRAVDYSLRGLDQAEQLVRKVLTRQTLP